MEIAWGGLEGERNPRMTRTNAGLISVLAIVASAMVAVPAAAADGYQSLNSVTAGGSQSEPYQSLNSLTGIGEGQPDSLAATAAPATVNAILADSPPAAADSRNTAGDDYRSLTSVVGDSEPPTSLVQVREASGFDWGDAGIGALVAAALAMTALIGTRLIGRPSHRTAASQA
jgi:hypothetical protein